MKAARMRRVRRLCRALGIDAFAASMILDLLERMERMERELERWRAEATRHEGHRG